MTFGTYIGINAAAGFLFGVALLLFPGSMLDLIGLEAGDDFLLISRLFGVELIGFNLATWPARKAPNDPASRVTAWGHMISEAIGSVVAFIAIAAGYGNALLWAVALMYLVFSATYAYFLLGRPART